MTTADALLADVIANPYDDTPRLVYADWLEETGVSPLRAEWIRRGVWQGEELTVSFHRQGPKAEVRPADGWERMLCYLSLPCGIPLCAVRAPIITYTVRRGFLDGTSLDLETFLAHAATLFRHHPITTVNLTDREPRLMSEAEGWYYWFEDVPAQPVKVNANRHWLPQDLFALLEDGGPVGRHHARAFGTEQQARAALSAACVAWGRQQARESASLVGPPA